MKLLVVLFAGFALCRSSVIPQTPKDNSHYVEGVSRYIWMHKDDEEQVLVDLQEPFEELSKNAEQENEYWLYTRNNPNDYQLLINGKDNSILNSNYRGDRPTFFLVHGWTRDGNAQSNIVQRNALLGTLDCNIIVVDWRNDAAGTYTTAVSRVPGVGVALGRFVEWLLSTTSSNWNSIHLIGYSLGAHVIGNAGRTVGGRPARLTGLDPAGPLWRLNENRLKENDGQYVEGIHTDGGIQGILSPVGDVDFYPNGGSNQPGCSNSNCNHARSYQLFASSIYTQHLVGRQCTSLTEAIAIRCSGPQHLLGTSDLVKRGSGIYGMTTVGTWPF